MLLILMLVYNIIWTVIYPMRPETMESVSKERLDGTYFAMALVLLAGLLEIGTRILIVV